MTSESGSVAHSGHESVVLASFDRHRHAEHMLASLGHGFREQARKGGATAVVVRGNHDGTLKVTESRVLSASDFAHTPIGYPSVIVGQKRRIAPRLTHDQAEPGPSPDSRCRFVPEREKCPARRLPWPAPGRF